MFCDFNDDIKDYVRPTWIEYFVVFAKLASARSTCLRRKVGCVLVKDNNIIATGYNGPPAGFKHCAELGGCIREKMGIPSGEGLEKCRALHGEQNALVQAAKHGHSVKGSTLFCTFTSCVTCTKLLINAGISQIYYIGDVYKDDLAMEMLRESDITVYIIDNNRVKQIVKKVVPILGQFKD